MSVATEALAALETAVALPDGSVSSTVLCSGTCASPITRAGWDLLRFTWHDLDGDPVGTVPTINPGGLAGATRMSFPHRR